MPRPSSKQLDVDLITIMPDLLSLRQGPNWSTNQSTKIAEPLSNRPNKNRSSADPRHCADCNAVLRYGNHDKRCSVCRKKIKSTGWLVSSPNRPPQDKF